MTRLLTGLLVSLLLPLACKGQESAGGLNDKPWSARIAESYLLRHPGAVTFDSTLPGQKWTYEQGLMLVALHQMWLHTNDKKYFEFIQNNLDQFVGQNGSIKSYKLADYNLDNIGPGRALLAVYQSTKEEKYRAAADTLRRQLHEQPRTHEGGFWHKKIYPYQMWLDGLFMAEPFYAWYAVMFGEESSFDDIANQFLFIAQHTRDSRTGLFYHGWDESKQERWANPVTGCSPTFWGRSMGWYAMGLVDVLDFLPENHPQRGALIAILKGMAEVLVQYQDAGTGLWYQVVDQGGRDGNYIESSASCMFAYSLAKGANKGYLDRGFFAAAQRAFDGIIKTQVTVDEKGFVDLHNTCTGAGLGNTPYRDGSFGYYISVPRRTNDMKGIGPFLLAAMELEMGSRKN